MIKKGDTLIEVTLAIGIFSMVAVSIVAVMGNGTASAETALETTLAREEIDAQADALRFIHSAFISDENHEDDRYAKLWEAITKNANDNPEAVADYSPTTCDAFYNKGDGASETILASQKAFAINTNYLGTYSNNDEINDDEVNKTVVSYKNDASKFTTAKTYPHLIYQSTDQGKKLEDESALTEKYNNFVRAEGIYVVAVKDPGTVVPDSNDTFNEVSAFYDFYIRSCWYGIGDDFPTTISTVIRLYNPDAIVARKIEREQDPTMQEAKPEYLNSKMPNNGDTITLKDGRDNKMYGIARINDQYWMTTNLAIGCEGDAIKSRPLSRSDTNNFWDSNTPTESLKSGDSYDQQRIECSSTYGGYYNYAAATNGLVVAPYTLQGAVISVCPSGWRLPSVSEAQNVIDATDYHSVFAPKRSGLYSSGMLQNDGSEGFWWTSGIIPQVPNQAYVSRAAIAVNNSGFYMAPWLDRQKGASIRCVKSVSNPAPPTMQEADIDYLASVMPNDGDTYSLKDDRNKKQYKIVRINDQYWMQEDLNFTKTELKQSDSNVARDTTISYNNFTDGGSYDNAMYHEENGKIYYNYAAASAMTITGDSNTDEAEYDICPKGWSLPHRSNLDALGGGNNKGLIFFGSESEDPRSYYNSEEKKVIRGTISPILWAATPKGVQNRGMIGLMQQILIYTTDRDTYSDSVNRKNGLRIRCVKK